MYLLPEVKNQNNDFIFPLSIWILSSFNFKLQVQVQLKLLTAGTLM